MFGNMISVVVKRGEKAVHGLKRCLRNARVKRLTIHKIRLAGGFDRPFHPLSFWEKFWNYWIKFRKVPVDMKTLAEERGGWDFKASGRTTEMLCKAVLAASGKKTVFLTGHTRGYTLDLVNNARRIAKMCGVNQHLIRPRPLDDKRFNAGLHGLPDVVIFEDHFVVEHKIVRLESRRRNIV